jgi:hypothetical protein
MVVIVCVYAIADKYTAADACLVCGIVACEYTVYIHGTEISNYIELFLSWLVAQLLLALSYLNRHSACLCVAL